MTKAYTEAYKKIKDAKNIVLATHINPDGDTISSALAMYAVLKRMGKKVYLYNSSSQLPMEYDFLPNFKRFKSVLPSKYDLLIALDSADFKRLGIEKVENEIINIDHHKSNTDYGTYNIVNPNRPSASLVVYDFLTKNNELISRDIATCIYTGLVSDTEFFIHRGVDDKVFKIAFELVKIGVDPVKVGENLKQRNSLAKLRLTELFLKSIELKKDAKVGVGKVTQSDFLKTGATKSDSEHLVNILISLATVKLALFLRELDNGEYKFSLRSKGDIDVSKIAIKYGGGGHHNAAGFTASLEAKYEIIEGMDI
jgi:phosphoesterase RecJ-like protein